MHKHPSPIKALEAFLPGVAVSRPREMKDKQRMWILSGLTHLRAPLVACPCFRCFHHRTHFTMITTFADDYEFHLHCILHYH